MEKMQQMPSNGKKVKRKKRSIHPKSVYRFYVGLFITTAVITCLVAFSTTSLAETYTYLKYVPGSIWLLALSIIFFDTLSIVYLQITYDYWLLAKKVIESGYWKKFRQMCNLSGFLVLLNVILMTLAFSFSKAMLLVLAGWVITGIIRFTRQFYLN